MVSRSLAIPYRADYPEIIGKSLWHRAGGSFLSFSHGPRMAILDVDRLLEPVSDDSPCGPNLEYDDAYAAFERAARGKAEQQYGETIIPAEEPDWPEVRRLGVELVARTKDLRVACQLARGLLETDGLTEFAASLALIRGYSSDIGQLSIHNWIPTTTTIPRFASTRCRR